MDQNNIGQNTQFNTSNSSNSSQEYQGAQNYSQGNNVYQMQSMPQNMQTAQYPGQRDWIIMIILWVFLGGIGVHRFYTKHYLIGTIYLVGSCLSASILYLIFWFVDLFLIVTGRYDTDADGIPLKK